uniref:Uncharacterized protein n=1 Tax=Sphaerodactylus townsendi TaxID=933632 RepID=A0ACB8F0U1_9SAUR
MNEWSAAVESTVMFSRLIILTESRCANFPLGVWQKNPQQTGQSGRYLGPQQNGMANSHHTIRFEVNRIAFVQAGGACSMAHMFQSNLLCCGFYLEVFSLVLRGNE